MKQIKTMCAILCAMIIAPFTAFARAFSPQGIDAINAQGTHENAITRTAEGTLTEHLCVSFGTNPAMQVRPCTAVLRPIGFAHDDAANGKLVGVELVGGGQTRLAIASKAIAAGVRVYATAGGKLTDAVVSGSWLVGEALTPAAADGDQFTILSLSPIVVP